MQTQRTDGTPWPLSTFAGLVLAALDHAEGYFDLAELASERRYCSDYSDLCEAAQYELDCFSRVARWL